MAQRVLEPGQIESLAQRSIPRVRLPDHRTIFARRAARLRKLTPASPIGGYLEMLALLADAQSEAAALLADSPLDALHLRRSREHGMPPLHAANGPRMPEWQQTLQRVCAPLATLSRFPRAVGEVLARISSASPAWLERQADAVLEPHGDSDIDVAAAPFIAAALQVHFVAAAASGFTVDQVPLLDAHGVCPLCGSLPVVSMVYAIPPHQGYRYLHCSLCATEWHMVRVQCTACGAAGKDVAYHTLQGVLSASDEPREPQLPAVRAETCDHCRTYRKILYEEQDPGVEPVADDLGTLALDFLLSEQNYHRASGNPLLWTPRPS
jgi:FdhE protein